MINSRADKELINWVASRRQQATPPREQPRENPDHNAARQIGRKQKCWQQHDGIQREVRRQVLRAGEQLLSRRRSCS